MRHYRWDPIYGPPYPRGPTGCGGLIVGAIVIAALFKYPGILLIVLILLYIGRRT